MSIDKGPFHLATPLNRPTTLRMVDAARASLAGIRAKLDEPDMVSKLATIDVILNELALREDCARHADYYARLLAVVDRGLTLIDAPRAVALRAALPGRLAEDRGFAGSAATIDAALAALEAIVEAAGSSPEGDVATFVGEALAVENALYAGMAADLPVAAPVADTLPTSATLQAYLDDRFPGEGRRVTAFRHLVGGYQKVTMLFATEAADGTTESLVLRGEKPDQFVALPASAVTDEFEIVNMAWDAGLPVAEPLSVEPDAAKLGRRFMVSRRVIGENLGTAIQANGAVSDATLRSFMVTLARIHATPVIGVPLPACLEPWRAHPSLAANTRAAVEMWRRQPWTEQASASPVMTRLYRWLADNVPPDEGEPCLVHVDYGPHNVLVADERVSGVLDWEAARLGDPAEDLSYLLQSLGPSVDRAAALRYYAEASGRTIGEFRLRYFDGYNLLKMIAGPIAAAAMFERTPEASIEWCNIPLKWMAFGAGGVDRQIAHAEAAR